MELAQSKAKAKCAPPGPPPAPKGKGKSSTMPLVEATDLAPVSSSKGKGKGTPPPAPLASQKPVADREKLPDIVTEKPTPTKGKGKIGPPAMPKGKGQAAAAPPENLVDSALSPKGIGKCDAPAVSFGGKSGMVGPPSGKAKGKENQIEDWRETLKRNKADGSQRHRIAAKQVSTLKQERAQRPAPAPVDRVKKRAGVWTMSRLLEAQQEDGHFDAEGVAAKLRQIYKAELLQSSDDFVGLVGKPDSFVTALVLRALDIFMRSSDVDPNSSPCGERWHECGKAWLEACEESDEIASSVEGLLDAWFALPRVEVKRGKEGSVISEEQRRRAEELRRAKAQALQEQEQSRADHWKALRRRSVRDVPWQDARITMYSEGGSGGAVLVQLGADEAVVLKPQGLSAASEAVAIGVAVEVGVRVAECRVLAAADDEYGCMLRKLSTTPTMVDGHDNYVRRTVGCGHDCVGILEFVQGTVLQGLPGQSALTCSSASSTLRQVGALIAMDCVLNNVDRIPAIWMNDGNLGNVMVTANGEVVGIDQQVNVIKDESQRQGYLQRVRDFVRDAVETRLDAPSLGRVQHAFLTNCGFDLGAEAGTELLNGAAETFRSIAQRAAHFQEALSNIERNVQAVFAHTARNHGQSQVQSMLEFVASNMIAIAEAIDNMPGAD